MNGRSGIAAEFCLTNTLTRRKERFVPREPGRVTMFTCGPSVYRRQHVGNYRTFLYEDVLYRYLEFLGYKVHRLINFTDVEDKAIEEAREQGLELDQLTRPVVEQFLDTADKLRIRLPRVISRSSTSVDTAAEIIRALIDRGHAYRHEGDVYFDPLTYPGFGRLYGLDMSQWPKERIRFDQDTYPGDQWNLGDFILWHACGSNDTVCWDTPLGRGRPSWNVQDPAMIVKHLGLQIDIHGGAVDNLFRHHDYILAIMESYSQRKYANFWLHGELLLVDGEKMSKSEGNVLYAEDFFDQGYSPEAVRFHFINGHYRQPIDFRRQRLDDTVGRLDRLTAATRQLCRAAEEASAPDTLNAPEAVELLAAFAAHMNDDLHVADAVDALEQTLLRLADSEKQTQLDPSTCAQCTAALNRIDSVLQVGLLSA